MFLGERVCSSGEAPAAFDLFSKKFSVHQPRTFSWIIGICFDVPIEVRRIDAWTNAGDPTAYWNCQRLRLLSRRAVLPPRHHSKPKDGLSSRWGRFGLGLLSRDLLSRDLQWQRQWRGRLRSSPMLTALQRAFLRPATLIGFAIFVIQMGNCGCQENGPSAGLELRPCTVNRRFITRHLGIYSLTRTPPPVLFTTAQCNVVRR